MHGEPHIRLPKTQSPPPYYFELGIHYTQEITLLLRSITNHKICPFRSDTPVCQIPSFDKYTKNSDEDIGSALVCGHEITNCSDELIMSVSPNNSNNNTAATITAVITVVCNRQCGAFRSSTVPKPPTPAFAPLESSKTDATPPPPGIGCLHLE